MLRDVYFKEFSTWLNEYVFIATRGESGFIL